MPYFVAKERQRIEAGKKVLDVGWHGGALVKQMRILLHATANLAAN